MNVQIKKSGGIKLTPQSITDELLLNDIVEVFKFDKNNELANLINKILNR